ncbi:hypothetical protein CHS0354_042270 [Potamilus streckersoni]|uniref:Uncharacterized protein n=1 Tax=Potamilus streckersoni TaxID=2493646 RepID=A0AAE0STU7_9BIVA|nr:hypothetical protein CHS0354_042270 [Potamilus streckersoni]
MLYGYSDILLRECISSLSGSCVSLTDQCPLGYGSTMSFCGFQEKCCIPPSSIHLGGSALGQTGSNGGGSGSFGSGGSVNTSYSALTNRK